MTQRPALMTAHQLYTATAATPLATSATALDLRTTTHVAASTALSSGIINGQKTPGANGVEGIPPTETLAMNTEEMKRARNARFSALSKQLGENWQSSLKILYDFKRD